MPVTEADLRPMWVVEQEMIDRALEITKRERQPRGGFAGDFTIQRLPKADAIANLNPPLATPAVLGRTLTRAILNSVWR